MEVEMKTKTDEFGYEWTLGNVDILYLKILKRVEGWIFGVTSERIFYIDNTNTLSQIYIVEV